MITSALTIKQDRRHVYVVGHHLYCFVLQQRLQYFFSRGADVDDQRTPVFDAGRSEFAGMPTPPW
jgi:hypothetical protein